MWDMNRFLLLAAGAIVLVTAFMFWADPTLIERIQDLWDIQAKGAARTATEVVYGHFPRTPEVVLLRVAFCVIFLGIGFAVARVMRARPLICAIAIACVAMTWSFAVDLIAYHDPDEFGARLERSVFIQTLQYWFIGCAMSSAISLLGASTVIWWRRRNAAVA